MLIDLVVFPWYSLALFAVFFFCGWFLFFRRAAYSFFDPVNFGANLTNAGTLTIYSSMKIEDALHGWDGIQVPLFTFLTLLSLRVSYSLPISKYLVRISNGLQSRRDKKVGIHLASCFLFFVIIVFVFVDKFGLPILYVNPMKARLMYADGNGSIRRILQASALFVQLTSVMVFVRYRLKSGLLIYITTSAIVAALLVSKSALIGQLITLIFLLNVHGNRKLDKYIIAFLPIGLMFSFYVIWQALSSVLPGVGIEQVLTAFTTRIIAFGDASFYALDSAKIVKAFYHDDLFDLIRTNLSSFLAPLRLISWDKALSTGGRMYAQIVGYYNGMGPNSTVQIEGWLYLGWFGIVYCIATAVSISIIRRISILFIRAGGIYVSFLGGTAFYGFTSVLVDGSYWGTTLISLAFAVATCLAVYSIYLIISVILFQSIVVERFPLLKGIK